MTTRRGDRTHTVLFDTGVSPNGLADNLERLDLDGSDIEAVVLSHGHFDHAGGFPGLAKLRRRQGLPITVHPLVWTSRRVVPPGQPEWELPVLSRSSLEAEGFEVIERRQPSLLMDGSILVTGEVDRTTDFETGMPFHEAPASTGWEPDPLILDDQALVVNVRDVGLVVVTGCGHAGAVNICRHALRLTGTARLAGLLGGFHLSGPAFEPIIEPTVDALASSPRTSSSRPTAPAGGPSTGWPRSCPPPSFPTPSAQPSRSPQRDRPPNLVPGEIAQGRPGPHCSNLFCAAGATNKVSDSRPA